MRAIVAIKEIVSFMSVEAIFGLIAGFLIARTLLPEIEIVPGIMVLILPIMHLRGCVASSLAARLGTAIHLGLIRWGEGWEELKQNIYASLFLFSSTSIVIGILADTTSRLLNLSAPRIPIIVLTSIAIIAGTLSGIVLTVITIFVALYTSKIGLDPDHVTIPFATTIGDILAVVFLWISVWIVKALGIASL